MLNEEQQVKEFMQKAGQDCPPLPTVPSLEVRKLRVSLIAEELMELAESLGISLEIMDGIALVSELPEEKPNLVEAYDAILDLQVVTIGTGVAMGMQLEEGWQEVHRSNMSKFIDGYRREDGKWMKGKSFTPPNLLPILNKQAHAAFDQGKTNES